MNEKSVVIVGDGPTGLSAAVLLAKNGFEVDVVGKDETPVHKALLHNYLGELDLPGPEFIGRAREQAETLGARLHQAQVEEIEAGDAFRIRAGARTVEARHLVLATGFAADLAQALGLETDESGVKVDRNGRTSRERVYAGGSLTRGMKSQVATSVGDGAAIAVDLLSKAAGKPTHDWDVLKQPARRREA